MNSLKECQISMNNIVQDTFTILKRPDTLSLQLCKELGIQFNIELGQINSETVKLLADNSWRRK